MNAGRREDVSKKIFMGSGEWGVGSGAREQGEGETRGKKFPPCLLVPLSPCLLVPLSPLPTPFLRAFDLACAALPNTLAFAVPNAFYSGCIRRGGSPTVREGLIRKSPPSRSGYRQLRASLERRLVHENLFDTGAQKSGHWRSR